MADKVIQIPKDMNADEVVQVLEVGLDIVSQDEWWTKGALCTPDGKGCALGALGVAAGVIPPNKDGSFSPSLNSHDYYPAGVHGLDKPHLGVAAAMLAEAADPKSTAVYAEDWKIKRMRSKERILDRLARIGNTVVPGWNDNPNRKKASVIAAFKRAIKEAKQQAEARNMSVPKKP